jgi:hypothetical protein
MRISDLAHHAHHQLYASRSHIPPRTKASSVKIPSRHLALPMPVVDMLRLRVVSFIALYFVAYKSSPTIRTATDMIPWKWTATGAQRILHQFFAGIDALEDVSTHLPTHAAKINEQIYRSMDMLNAVIDTTCDYTKQVLLCLRYLQQLAASLQDALAILINERAAMVIMAVLHLQTALGLYHILRFLMHCLRQSLGAVVWVLYLVLVVFRWILCGLRLAIGKSGLSIGVLGVGLTVGYVLCAQDVI